MITGENAIYAIYPFVTKDAGDFRLWLIPLKKVGASADAVARLCPHFMRALGFASGSAWRS
jgi:hypothetical protein